MMIRRAVRLLLLICFLPCVSNAYAQTDAIDLHKTTVHGSPLDVANWPATVSITKVTMRPTGAQPDGVAFETTAIPQSWDYHVPGWGTGSSCPAEGCIFYTVWPVVQVNGGWHTAGIIQMWQGRPSTGAPILTDFHSNWAYARDRWGDLNDYLPQVGDQVGFFLTAGNARDAKAATSVKERSNVVLVRLPSGDAGAFEFGGTPEPTPAPVPVPDPPSGGTVGPQGPPGPQGPKGDKGDPADAVALDGILARLAAIEGRLQVLEARPVLASCTAAIRTGAFNIPISCRLNP